MTVEIQETQEPRKARLAQPRHNPEDQARYLAALNATRSADSPTRAPRVARGKTFARRHTGRAKSAFLDAFSHYGNVGYCADLVGIGRSTVYDWLENDEQFSMAYHQAEKRALETLEAEAWRRAVEGSPYTRTSYYRGEPVGTDHKIEYSDQLMMLLLRARAPERYRERMDVSVSQVVKTIAGVDPATVL